MHLTGWYNRSIPTILFPTIFLCKKKEMENIVSGYITPYDKDLVEVSTTEKSVTQEKTAIL